MFHVERRFSEEIVRAAGNIVPCGTFRGYMGAISKTLFHVEPSCAKPEVGVQNLAYAAKQFASRVRMGDGAACSAEITGNRISSESRWDAMFHVEQSRRIVQDPMPEGKVLCYQVDGSTTTGEFFVPTRSSRRSEFGTWMGSAQSQVRFFWISGRSRAPIQRITCFAAICCEFAHSRKAGNSPSAREQTKSRGATSSPSSS